MTGFCGDTVKTPYHGSKEPFELRSGKILFHDWRYVYHGGTGWVTRSGENLGLWSQDPVPELRWAGGDLPTGIKLKVIRAKKSDPVIEADRPWEGMLHSPSLMNIGDRYRLWYESVPPEDMGKEYAGRRNLLCYAESEDTEEWRKPELGVTDYLGIEGTNIVYGGSLTGETGYHGGSVFLDRSAPEGERYKAIHLGFLSRERYDKLREERGGEADPNNEGRETPCAIFGAVSPDGVHWEGIPNPLVLQYSDTQNVAYYDPFLERYVAYTRTWVMGRRSVGRSESLDFRVFPQPETFLWPDASVGPSDLWYANGKTSYPDSEDYHLLFPKRWRVSEDRFYVHLSTSPDGMMWGPPVEVLAPGEPGEWDHGGVDVGPGMVHLPGSRVGVPFIGYAVPHKYTRHAPVGKIALAYWREGRLMGIEAEEKGWFRTTSVRFEGRRLHVNASTERTGEIRIGVSNRRGVTIEGRSESECEAIIGDHLDKTVTWDGSSDIGNAEGEAVSFRVSLRQARLFAMWFT